MKKIIYAFYGSLCLTIVFVCSPVSTQEADANEAGFVKQGLLSGWAGDIFTGYSQSNGNTEKGAASISANAIKKIEKSEFTLKGNLHYSESNNNMDTQKWDALAKYSVDFGKTDNWFTFTQVFVDHDYFADIDYRVTPSAGLGYHIVKTEKFTWDVDGGLGYRITRNRINTAADDETITGIVHTFSKLKIFEKCFLSEDLVLSPAFKSDTGNLIRSETAFTNSLNNNLDLEFKYIADFNSEPAVGKKKSDTLFIAGLKYKY